MLDEKEELINSIKYLLNLIPIWAKTPAIKGFGEMYYGTLSYEGDAEVIKRVNLIRELIN